MKTAIRIHAVFLWALCFSFSASAAQVTFRVNMSVQVALGLFDPANDQVVVAGDFNSWSTSASPLAPSGTDPNIYVGTFEAGAAGTWVNYKYVKNRFGMAPAWENDGVGGNGIRNRFFQVGAGQVLEVVYFNNIEDQAENYAPVTFQVDMSVMVAQGSFDPVSGTITVAGNAINNWSPTQSPLARSSTDPNLWTGTYSVTNPVGGTVSYKFLMNGVWETTADRTFIMTNQPLTLPRVYFSNVTNTASPIPLTFEVNMGVAMARGTFQPAQGDYVEARGSFLVNESGNWLGGFVLTNDSASPLLYRGTIIDTKDAAGSVIQYQFVINGSTWEATGNRLFTLTSANPTTLPPAFLNNIADLGPVVIRQTAPAQFSLTWNGGPAVRVQSSIDLVNWLDVPDTIEVNAIILNEAQPRRFFRLMGP